MDRSSAPNSLRRPLLLGAGVLFLLFSGVGAAVAWVGSNRVAAIAGNDRRAHMEDDARRAARALAGSAADAARPLFDDARLSAEILSRAVRDALEAPPWDPADVPQFTTAGEEGLRWSVPALGVFCVTGEDPASDARLSAVAASLAPILRATAVRDASRAVVRIDGLGAVGAPADWIAAAPDPSAALRAVWSGRTPVNPQVGAAWNDTDASAVRHEVPVAGDDGLAIGAASVAVDPRALGDSLDDDADAPGARLVLSSGGRVVAASSRAARILAVADGADGAELTAAVQRFLGGRGVFYPSPAGHHVVSGALRFAAAPVPGTPYSAAWVGPASVPAPGPTAAADAAHRFGLAVAAFAAVLGAVCILAAAAVGRLHGARTRAVLAGVDAHERGDYQHAVPAAGDDEMARVARWMNVAASRLRTALTRAEEGERRLSSLVESMGDGFATTDVDDRILHVNPRFADLLRRPAAALAGRFVEEFLHPESVDRWRIQSQRLREGRAMRFEAVWNAGQAKPLRTIVSGVPLFDAEGRPGGSYVVVTDITDRVRVHEEVARAEKVRALAEMAGGVAHDFNNVLTVILGNAQFLLLEDLADEPRETLKAIERAALQGTETVRRIREFSRTRTVPLTAEPFGVNDIVGQVVDAARERLGAEGRARGVEYRIEVDRGSQRRVRGNPDELREALANVVENALEAMPRGGTLTVAAFDRGEDAVGIRIEDTGVGIAPEIVGKIFDPFFTTKPGGRCVGLGLSIAFGIVRAHRGRIDVRSQPGAGSTFTVVLPAAAADAEGARPREASPATSDSPRVEPRVLVVGGEPNQTKDLVTALRGLGIYAANVHPASAVSLASDGAIFNTLVVEFDLGGSTGWELARQARAAREDLRIVLLTAPAHPVSETQARNAGIDRVLVRPFDVRDLHAEVFALLAAPREQSARPASASERSQRRAARAARSPRTAEVWRGNSGGAPADAAAPPPAANATDPATPPEVRIDAAEPAPPGPGGAQE